MSGELKDNKDIQATELFTAEDFENLNLPEVLPPYTGEGATSYASKGDIQKKGYLESLGIEIPDTWIGLDNESILPETRALFVTAFIVTGHILVLEQIRRDNIAEPYFEEAFQRAIDGRIKQIKESRLDLNGYRQRLPSGKLIENYYSDLGLSANPEKEVSEAELRKVTRYIFSQLNGEKAYWLDMD